MKTHLKERGMAMKQGTIIDANLVAPPSFPKNKAGERDPEMHQTKKGNQWYSRCAEGFAYRMKVQHRSGQGFRPDPLGGDYGCQRARTHPGS
jgi:hypothetical protein